MAGKNFAENRGKRVRCRPQGLHERSHFCSSAKQVIGIFKHELQQIN